MISNKKLYEFCRDHYYSKPYECTSDNELWSPFEGLDVDDIDGYIRYDVDALKKFLENNLNKEWDEEDNKDIN